MKYKTLRGFLNGKVDYDKLAEVRKNAIETKRAELIEQWTKFNLDPHTTTGSGLKVISLWKTALIGEENEGRNDNTC